MKIKVKVSYPWANIPDDEEIIETEEDELEIINKIVDEIALNMIFTRGIEYDYEILEWKKVVNNENVL